MLPITTMKAPGSIRPGIWRNGVLQVKVTNACDLDCQNCSAAVGLAKKHKRVWFMKPDQFRMALQSLKGYFGVIGVFGGNPSVIGGTRVYTTKGIFPIEDLANKFFQVRNLHGKISPAICRLSGRNKQLYQIKLRGGHSYFATPEHEWPALELSYGKNHKRKDLPDYNPRLTEKPLGKIKTQDLKPGMRLPVLKVDTLGFGIDGSVDDGFLAGWLLGDGWISRTEKTTTTGLIVPRTVIGLIVNAADKAAGIADRLTSVIRQLGSDAMWRAAKMCHEISITHSGVFNWMERFGVISKAEGVPAAVWTTGSEEFRRGFIDGLFSADGHVEQSRRRGYIRVRLTSAHEKLVRDVSELLGFYGIKTQITRRERVGNFPNKKDYGKIYTAWELSISDAASVQHFACLFPLTHKEKNARLQAQPAFRYDVEATNIEIESITPTDRYEDVWDISVDDDTHCFQLAHCVTGNCLHPNFEELCAIFREEFPDKDQRGLWCNHPRGKGKICRETFSPIHSNLNVHRKQEAYDEFVRDWPEVLHPANRVLRTGLEEPSTHGSWWVAMKDIIPSEEERWKLIGSCYVNQTWSAEITVIRGELKAFFCEWAATVAEYHDLLEGSETDDLGLPVTPGWWRKPMAEFEAQVRHYCHGCGAPLNPRKIEDLGKEPEDYTKTSSKVFLTIKGRPAREVTTAEEIMGDVPATKYLPKNVMRPEN